MGNSAVRVVLAGWMAGTSAFGAGSAWGQSFTEVKDVPAASGTAVPAATVPTASVPATKEGSGAGPMSGARPSADEIVARMLRMNEQRLAALERYTSERTYQVEYHGTGGEHHAEIRVHAEYTGPNQKRLTVVAETGPRFLCEKVLRKLVESEQEASEKGNRTQMTLSKENYDVQLVGEDLVESPSGRVKAWVLQVAPKVDNKFTYRGKVWVSQDDYAAMRIVGEPAKNPSWWINRASIDSRYVRRGDVWLPAKNVSSSHVRIGGEATLTIDYGAYPVVEARGVAGLGAVETVASFSH